MSTRESYGRRVIHTQAGLMRITPRCKGACGCFARRAVIALAVISCAVVVSSCSAGARSHLVVSVKTEQVALVPDVDAGTAGWCIVTGNGGACPVGLSGTSIITQSWSGSGPPPVYEGYAVTTGKVAAVSVDGGPAIPTRIDRDLPAGWRVVSVEAREKGHSEMPVPRFAATNAAGERLPATRVRGLPLSIVEVPTRAVPNPGAAGPSSEVCRIRAMSLPGLLPRGGSVITTSRPYATLGGDGLLSCASSSYELEGWPILVGVLLSASHPGTTPTRWPALRPLSGHPGVFESPGIGGEMLARQISGAWLVVAKGKGVQQRATLLEHLSATVNL